MTLDYKKLRGIEGVKIPNKEELKLILQHHHLCFRDDMSREQLWNIWATYFNVSDEFITLMKSDESKQKRIELNKVMQNMKCI